MRVLAENGIDVLNTDSKGYNALHIAAKFKYDNLVKMLVNSKYPLDEQTNDGETAVAIASQRGNFEILKTLQLAGADLNILNKFDLSPLYLAILNNKLESGGFLIEENAKIFYHGSLNQRDCSPIF